MRTIDDIQLDLLIEQEELEKVEKVFKANPCKKTAKPLAKVRIRVKELEQELLVATPQKSDETREGLIGSMKEMVDILGIRNNPIISMCMATIDEYSK